MSLFMNRNILRVIQDDKVFMHDIKCERRQL